MKIFKSMVPCCGVSCGGCSFYTRIKSTCSGASTRCIERKCGFYKCCVEKKGLRFCFECKTFPCSRFRKFAETWLKLGQDLISNQLLLKEKGSDHFLKQYNSKVISNKMNVILISENKKQFLDLLLLGDEQENMIDRYLEQGDLFALYDEDLKSVCVVTAIDDSSCELKNIATYQKYQGQGYGSILINYLFDYYKGKYKTMLVGTGEDPSILSFYKRFGFEPSHRIENFFTDNYDHPIFENGVQLVDMIYLKKDL